MSLSLSVMAKCPSSVECTSTQFKIEFVNLSGSLADTDTVEMTVNGIVYSLPVDSVSGDFIYVNKGTLSCTDTSTYMSFMRNGISMNNCGRDIALPVTLIHFKATVDNELVTLNWATAQELNNGAFDVERSIDGINWSMFTRIEGHGTTSQRHDYSCTDMINRTTYYRLQQIDYDGDYEYSYIIVARYVDDMIPIGVLYIDDLGRIVDEETDGSTIIIIYPLDVKRYKIIK